MKDHDYLLDAVDGLTKPVIGKVLQANDAGIECLSPVENDSLLGQLRTAVAANATGGNGVPGQKDRIPLNAAAFELYSTIEATAGGWLTDRGIPEYGSPERNIRQWFLAHRADPRGHMVDVDALEADRARTLTGWAAAVRVMLDPPGRLEVTFPCPACGERWAYDPATGDRIGAVVIDYSRDDPLNTAAGKCRACGTEWTGLTAVRLMRFSHDTGEVTP